MADLSDERKRQIREEERVKLERQEQEYREQVKQELEQEETYREQVRQELEGGAAPEPPVKEPSQKEPPNKEPASKQPTKEPATKQRAKEPTTKQPTKKPASKQPARKAPSAKPAQKKPRAQAPQPRRAPSKANAKPMMIAGGTAALIGLVLCYYAYFEGFPIPGIDGPFKSSLTASATSSFTVPDTPDWKPEGMRFESFEIDEDGEVTTVEESADAALEPPEPLREAIAMGLGDIEIGTRTDPRPDTSEDIPPRTTRKSNSLEGGAVSFNIPAGWETGISTSREYVASKWVEYDDMGSYVSVSISMFGPAGYTSLESMHTEHMEIAADAFDFPGGTSEDDEHSQDTDSGLTFRIGSLTPVDDDWRGPLIVVFTAVRNGALIWFEVTGDAEAIEEIDTELEAIFKSIEAR